jgi:hypothetical protein
MQNDAQDLQQQLAAIKADTENLLAGLNDAQFNWRPDANHWSIAQCLDHLNVLGYLYLEQFPAKIAAGPRLTGAPNYQMGWLSRFFIKKMEPPVTTKFKAPPPFVPAPEKPLDEVAPKFFQLQDQLAEQINAARNVDWSRVKLVSPASKLIHFNLTAAFAVLTSHERRHLWQAWQVRKNPDFPTS